MCGPYFNFSAAKVSEYHIHIYTRDGWEDFLATALAGELQERFPGQVSAAHKVGKVGPHTLDNTEVDIKPEAFGDVVRFLQMNAQGMSILIHPRTGDEFFDHKQAAMWIGEPVAFNDKFFDAIHAAQSRQANAQARRRPPNFGNG